MCFCTRAAALASIANGRADRAGRGGRGLRSGFVRRKNHSRALLLLPALARALLARIYTCMQGLSTASVQSTGGATRYMQFIYSEDSWHRVAEDFIATEHRLRWPSKMSHLLAQPSQRMGEHPRDRSREPADVNQLRQCCAFTVNSVYAGSRWQCKRLNSTKLG